MNNIKDALTESLEYVNELKSDAKHSCVKQTQLKCQEWALNTMLNTVNKVQNFFNTPKTK